MGLRPLVMCSAVCSAPQSQQSLVDSPQRSMFAPNLPTPVRNLFFRVQARRDRPTLCLLFDGVGMCSLMVVDAHDSVHLVCVANTIVFGIVRVILYLGCGNCAA